MKTIFLFKNFRWNGEKFKLNLVDNSNINKSSWMLLVLAWNLLCCCEVVVAKGKGVADFVARGLSTWNISSSPGPSNILKKIAVSIQMFLTNRTKEKGENCIKIGVKRLLSVSKLKKSGFTGLTDYQIWKWRKSAFLFSAAASCDLP